MPAREYSWKVALPLSTGSHPENPEHRARTTHSCGVHVMHAVWEGQAGEFAEHLAQSHGARGSGAEAGGGGGTHSRHHCRPCGVRGHVTGTRLCGLGRGCRRHGLLSAPWVATCLSPRGPGEGGHSLVVVVFHELLELLDVAHGLQVLLHVGQGREVICKRQTNPEASVPLHLWARNETCRDHRFWR